MVSKDLIKQACILIDRAIEVSNESEADIFARYSAHVSEVEIRIYELGWKRGESPCKEFRIDLGCEYTKKEFKELEISKALAAINSLMDKK